MPALTQSFTFDFMTNCQAIAERSYQGKLAALRYQRFTKTRTSNSAREVLAWLLSTARIRRNGQGGNIRYESLSQVKQTYVNGNFSAGLEVGWNEFSDLDGHGVDITSEWYDQIGADIAYFPQRETVSLVLNGEVGICYDGKAFFATDHPNNPNMVGSGTYANLFTGAASGAYPGACPIDETSVTADVALANLGKLRAYIHQIKMPNNVDPRFLTIDSILHPPALANRVTELMQAKYLASASDGSGGGTSDKEAVIKRMGWGEPIEMAELGAGQSYTVEDPDTGVQSTVTGSDTTYYVVAREASTSEIGGMVWINREPVVVQAFTGLDGKNVELAEARKMKHIAQGRATGGYGLPYFVFKCKAS